ncbi:MAG TPA: class I SAM-dependent rRNA methyltransferase [Schlesneria sp.]|jgi:23S rRNA (cytosine1962-C5)-methyltransferase
MPQGILYHHVMPPKRPNIPPQQRPRPNRRPSSDAQFERLAQRPIAPEPNQRLPKIVSKSGVWHPFLFRRQLGDFDPTAQPGDLVEITNPSGATQGFGLFNPKAEISIRLLRTGLNRPEEAWWSERLESAVALRREFLKLDAVTDAYRVIHAEADGLPGLVVDKFGDVLVAECFSLGMYQRAEAILTMLEPMCGTKYGVIRPAPNSEDHEGFAAAPTGSEGLPAKAVVHEFDTQFRVDFAGGHKTGFYCDQRDNRKQLATFCGGKTVLDLCSYTGGFAVQAMKLGQATEVTGVELDESASALARENAKLNRVKLSIVQADAFAYMRDMLRNGRKYDVVVLDPPKLIRSRDEIEEGRRKYYDFNRLAMQLVAPEGLLLTCSCSGLLDIAEFSKIVCAAPEVGRRVQVLMKGGAAADHPIATNCPESEYLKTMWLRLE